MVIQGGSSVLLEMTFLQAIIIGAGIAIGSSLISGLITFGLIIFGSLLGMTVKVKKVDDRDD